MYMFYAHPIIRYLLYIVNSSTLHFLVHRHQVSSEFSLRTGVKVTWETLKP
jgi:hypothetical protein